MNKILNGDAVEQLKTIQGGTVQTCITSPPYFGLRDYGHSEQIGLENTPEEYVAKLVDVFREVRRVLKDDGTLWLNLGDSYNSGNGFDVNTFHRERDGFQNHKAKDRTVSRWGGGKNKVIGLKPKDLIGIPWMVAFAIRADGWYLRQDIIWSKPNPMPESVTDRCTKSHEYIFLLSKNKSYYYNADAIKEKSVGTDPRMIDGFVPKSVNGKHADDPQNTANRNKDQRKVGGLENSKGDAHKTGTRTGKNLSDAYKDNPFTMRNKRSVWTVTTSPYPEAHFATYPEKLVEPMILAGSKQGDIVLDCFAGSGTTLSVAKRLGRSYLGIELNEDYLPLIEKRLSEVQTPML